MNRKLKEQLELVITQCSALKAKLDEATARNRQYEAQIEQLRKEISQQQSVTITDAPPEPQVPQEPQDAQEPQEAQEPEKAKEPQEPEIAIPADIETPDSLQETAVAVEEPTEAELTAEIPTPATEVAPEVEAVETEGMQSISEIGAELIAQAKAASDDYIRRLESAHPNGCNSLTDIIRCRTDLFKAEISGIIDKNSANSEKLSSMCSALIKLVQYFEDVK